MSNKRQFWFQHVEQWEQSGLSQAEYARHQGLSVTTFGYYRRCYIHQKTEPETPSASLLPVNVVVDEPAQQLLQTSSTGITLTSPGGFRIELSSDFDSVALQKVLEILEAA